MKIIKYTAAAALLSGVASAQGLFDVLSSASESESRPLSFTAGVAYGYNDNANPTDAGPENSSSYASANIGASMIVRGEQTSWDFSASTGETYYFDNSVANDSNINVGFGININHRINDRIRLVSSNHFSHGLDLGNYYGATSSRDTEEVTHFTTDNSIGFEWTDRLGTYTGFNYSTALFADNDTRDMSSYGLYHSFRYMLNERTTLTTSLGWSTADFDFGEDSNRVTYTVGFEHRLTEVSSVGLRVGAQGGDYSSPYGSINYSYQVNDRLSASAFARYSQEDIDTVPFFNDRYKDKTVLRIGGAASYTLSPKVSLTIGGNYSMSDSEAATALPDDDEDSLNIYLSGSYSIRDNLSAQASVNHTSSNADVALNRDYDSIRYQIGLNYSF